MLDGYFVAQVSARKDVCGGEAPFKNDGAGVEGLFESLLSEVFS